MSWQGWGRHALDRQQPGKQLGPGRGVSVLVSQLALGAFGFQRYL